MNRDTLSIEIRENPAARGRFDFWIFAGIDPDALHHGAGYPSRVEAHDAARAWIDDHERGGFK